MQLEDVNAMRTFDVVLSFACKAISIVSNYRYYQEVSVTGAPPSIAPLLAYLEEKYATLYDL
ncbi:MAG: hypothetical protein IID00_01995 [Chloroflexi bacterium]|nr:hypothetical protein [Chloroflexota bacterium]